MSNPLRNNWDLVLSGLLRCIYQVPFLEKYSSFIKPKYFFEGESDPKVLAMRKMFDLILDIYRQRRHKELLGSLLAFEIEVKKLSDGEVLDECLNILAKFDPEKGDPKLVKMATSEQCESQFLDFLKMVAVREWATEFGEPYKKGHMAEAQKCVDDLSNRLKSLNTRTYKELDTDKIPEFLEHMNSRVPKNFRIGIPKLDNGHGWIEPQTLNLFAAPPGRGKSMMANTLIRLAIKQGKYVHLTVVENREENFLPRCIAALSGIQIDDLKRNYNNFSSELKSNVKKAADLVNKYITVTFMYGQGIEAVHSMKLEKMGIRAYEGKPKFDIDIIDYTGHIVHYSGNAQDPQHTRFRNAYAMRKDFALNHDLICFDFVQINREGTKKNDFGASKMGMNDLATSFDLSQVCDTLITINQSDFDRTSDEAKLYVAKGREGGLGEEITVKTSFKYGRFGMNYDPSMRAEPANAGAVVSEGIDAELTGKVVGAEIVQDPLPDNVTTFPEKQ